MEFKELKLNEKILKSLDETGFTEPTEIQYKAIPLFLDNKNIFGKSSTGTGKTASFVLPALNKIDVKLKEHQVLIMAPTRELAYQIVGEIRKFSSNMPGLTVATVIGGAPMREQIRRLKTSQVIVGTPGRINDHINRKTINFDWINTIILDEADEMLKMGFKKEIDAVFNNAKPEAQRGLFSATNSPKVLKIAENYMPDYELIEIKNQVKVNSNIENTYIFTKGVSKEELILEVIKKHNPKKAIIFSNTKANTDKIARNLKAIDVKSVVINGDKKQTQRTRAIKQFKNGEFQVLVATDVVARGIDIEGIDFVINYDISMEDEQFVHRIGRTGRNNNKGSSISFIQNKSTLMQLRAIEKRYGLTVNEVESLEYGVKVEERSRNERRSDSNRDRSNSGRGRSYGNSNGRSNSSRNSNGSGRSRDFNGNRRSSSDNNNNRRSENGNYSKRSSGRSNGNYNRNRRSEAE